MAALAEDSERIKEHQNVVTQVRLTKDAQTLQRTRRESVLSSPDAFLSTLDDIDTESARYWENELRSSTWAVAEDENRVLGIAAAKRPDPDKDAYANPLSACFIESIWIRPSVRRQGFGEHLVKYLIETQRNKGIHQFYLWVFIQNEPARNLYERLGFKPTQRAEFHPTSKFGVRVCEIQYVLAFDSAVIGDTESNDNAASREWDREAYGVTYRILG